VSILGSLAGRGCPNLVGDATSTVAITGATAPYTWDPTRGGSQRPSTGRLTPSAGCATSSRLWIEGVDRPGAQTNSLRRAGGSLAPDRPDVPTRVLAGRHDRMFPLEFQRRIARQRLGLEVDEIDGGHMVAMSNPTELAGRLEAYLTDLQDRRRGLDRRNGTL
jgi:pimeloyl-ACP methyl ester carboxylesterase